MDIFGVLALLGGLAIFLYGMDLLGEGLTGASGGPQIETPGQTPHPDTNSAPQGVPMTNGTPAACYQKNAREFLAGDVQTSVMAHYAPGLFSTDQHTHSCHPAPDEDASQVLSLVDWREDAPYG